MSTDTRGGALYIYAELDFRYGLIDSDVPGSYALVYDEWDDGNWVRMEEFPLWLDAAKLIALAEAARVLSAWEEGDTEIGEITVTVKP